MAGVDVESGRGRRRSVDSEINMVPMIDLLMVTVSFLLITAVWAHSRRLEGTAKVPGPAQIAPRTEDHARVHVEVPPGDEPLRLTLRRGATVLASQTVPRYDVADLAHRIDGLRRAQGCEDDPNVVVMHVENALRYRDMVAVMDAIAADPRSSVSLAMK
jgi:biopolymer transport protein ExbD